MRTPRNPDLPIVDELRAEMRARIIAEDLGPSRATPQRHARARLRPPQPRRRRLGFAGRVTRRSTVIVALLCLIGGVALAQLNTRSDGPPRHTEPRVLDAGNGWTISGYRDEARLCVLFSAGSAKLASDCGPVPAPRQLRATSVRAGGRRFVVGLAGAEVSGVAVRVGKHRGRTATRRPSDSRQARKAGVPPGIRWFVVGAGLGASPAPAHVVGLDRSGNRLGPELLDCSLDLVGAACERAYEERAYERLR